MTPLTSASLASLARLRDTSRPVVAFVVHGWGGGIHRHLDDLETLLYADCSVLRLTPGPGGSVHLECRRPEAVVSLYFSLPAEFDLLATTLAATGVCRMHFHHLHGLPRAVLELPHALGVAYDVTLHDYYALCWRAHFVDTQGRYCGDPEGRACLGCRASPAGPWNLTLEAWRQCFHDWLAGAARRIAPSHDTAARYHRYWPELAIDVWPHPEAAIGSDPAPVRVLLLGRLSPEKGLRVVADCAADARARKLPLAFRILGSITEVVPLAPAVPLTVLGEYTDDALPNLLASERPDVLFFPAQVPETYAYTLSVALASGVAVVASALGAFPERLAGYERAALLPWDAKPAQWNDCLLSIALPAARGRPAVACIGSLPEAYREQYLAPGFDGGARGRLAFPELPARLATPPPVEHPPAFVELPELYRAGVEWGQAESRVQLRRRMAEVAGERARLATALIIAIQGEEAAKRAAEEARRSSALAYKQTLAVEGTLHRVEERLRDIEESTSWRMTASLRHGITWVRVQRARLRALAGSVRHWPRQASIAREILRVDGPAGLMRRVRSKLGQTSQFLPVTAEAYRLEDTPGPLAFRPPQEGEPVVSIVVPVHGKPLLTYSCLKSVLAHTAAGEYEIVIVDDASPQPLAEALPELEGVRIERFDDNRGFVASCRRGAEVARGKILVFLNNDTLVTPGWLVALLDILDTRPQAGLVGAKLIYPDGRLQEAGGIVWRDGSAWNVGRGDDPRRPEYNYVREADYCSGACLAISAALFRAVGGFDLRYAPAYYEDTDLAFAVRAAGRKVLYQPAAVIVHFEGQTSGTDMASGMKRHQAEHQGVFAQKWERTLAFHRSNGNAPELERDRYVRHRVLVIDACMLTPDHDSGSMRMQAILELLVELECKVSFVADNLECRQPYVADLQQRGIEVLYGPYVRSISELLSERGREFDVIVISRHYIAAKHIEAARSFAPSALIVFDTVDLHFLRAERLAEIEDSAMGKAAARAKREEELALIRQADVTLVVSDVEKSLLERLAPDADVMLLSNVHDPMPRGKPFAERSGLVFIGGFQHPPNTDAVLWYAAEVLPRLRVRLPGVPTFIVGSGPPAAIRALATEDLIVTGYVPDVAPYFEGCRVSIAPLRYGAGVKGKVNLAMSYGLPVVATPASVEGMHLTPGEDVAVGETAEAFADAVVEAYRDEALWQRLAAGGRANIRDHFSRDVARATLSNLIAKRSAGKSS